VLRRQDTLLLFLFDEALVSRQPIFGHEEDVGVIGNLEADTKQRCENIHVQAWKLFRDGVINRAVDQFRDPSLVTVAKKTDLERERGVGQIRRVIEGQLRSR
jgi:hypothetical protein